MRPRLPAALLGCLGAGALALAPAAPVGAATVPAPGVLSVSSTAAGPSIPSGFLGLTTEYWDIPKLEGTTTNTPDKPFERLWKALSPGSDPNLRIAGDSSDWVWWPIPGMATPPWVHFSLTPQYAATVKELANDTRAKLMMGINFGADSSAIASYEVKQLKAALPANRVLAYELGNEPDLYNVLPYYYTAGGAQVRARPASYGPAAIASDWQSIASNLGGVPLAGPAYSNFLDLSYVHNLVSSHPGPKIVTVHTYPLVSEKCNGHKKIAMASLFDEHSLVGLQEHVAQFARVANAGGAQLRADEMNSVTCGGQSGFSGTFGPALWALNILPLYAETTVSGVNFDFETYTAQDLFKSTQTSKGWQVTVQPEYYGLRAFGQLAPPGSHILSASTAPNGLLMWADKTPSHQTNVVVTNITTKTMTTKVSVAGVGTSTTGQLTRLQAAKYGLWAQTGVTLAGQSENPSTGEMTGKYTATPVAPSHGTYSITVPADSAAILTLGPSVAKRASRR